MHGTLVLCLSDPTAVDATKNAHRRYSLCCLQAVVFLVAETAVAAMQGECIGRNVMGDYRRLDDGMAVSADSLERGIWYAGSLGCGYWTDDWSKLMTKHPDGIPRCPHCGCVGMQTTARDWFTVPYEFLLEHQRYDEWLPQSKEHCGRSDSIGFMDAYRLWLGTQRNAGGK